MTPYPPVSVAATYPSPTYPAPLVPPTTPLPSVASASALLPSTAVPAMKTPLSVSSVSSVPSIPESKASPSSLLNTLASTAQVAAWNMNGSSIPPPSTESVAGSLSVLFYPDNDVSMEEKRAQLSKYRVFNK